MTKHELKKQAYLDRVARHKAGLCVECDTPPSLNQDGTQGLRCDEHKRKWLVNRSRVSAELKAEIPQTQYRVRRSSEEMDNEYQMQYTRTEKLILPFILKQGDTNVARIKREFPDAPYLDVALKMLKLDGKIDYDEYAVYPVKVWVGSMARVTQNTTGYNNQATFAPANPRTEPDPQSLYGAEHARQF